MSGTNLLRVALGITALVAPFIHSITDAMEWYQHGFSTSQLWLNYVAFVPMSWLLLGIYAVHEPKPGAAGRSARFCMAQPSPTSPTRRFTR